MFQPEFKDPKWEESTTVTLTHFHMFVLLGEIELALRHPQNTGPSAQVARDIGRQMAAHLAATIDDVTPEFVRAANWPQTFGLNPQAAAKIITSTGNGGGRRDK